MTTTTDENDLPTPELDMARLEAFGARMLDVLNLGMTATMTSVGHQVGLFDTMALLARPETSGEIARAAGLDERYVREWLGAMTTAGVVEHDGGSGTYLLPAEHAALLTRAAGPNNLGLHTQFITMCGAVEPELVQAFRSGGGVPYSSFGRFHEVMREVSAAQFDAGLVDVTLPLVPGALDALRAGARVADVGCGSGHAVNVMARAFPESTFVGFDIAEDALAVGRAEAGAWGLGNAEFRLQDAASTTEAAGFDLVTTFDAVHDQADPARMVARVFEMLRPEGRWLCVDVQASSELERNLDHPLGPFLYSVSCAHCMTVSLAHDGAGLGAMWGEETARTLFADAGFVDLEVHHVEGDVVNSYYVCRRP